MFELALDTFKEALIIYPENPNILYYAGLCSARLSKTKGLESESNDYLYNAERYYKASLIINKSYSSPMYGLAVLYVFEMDQPEKAVPLLEAYNIIQKSSMRGRFLLATAYYSIGDSNRAVDVYNEIINKSSNEAEIESARENRNLILQGVSNG